MIPIQANPYSIQGTLIYSSFDITGNGVSTLIDPTNIFWINSKGNDGPLNRCGGWASGVAEPFQKIGFSVCQSISIDKVYQVGFGADNYAMLIVDGDTLINQPYTEGGENFVYWKIFKVNLKKGSHLIEVLGTNGTAPPATIGLEIYDNTDQEIMNAHSYSDLNLIFSSKDQFNKPVQAGDPNLSYSCPIGYMLDYCSYSMPMCSREISSNPPILKINEPLPSCPKVPVDLTNSDITRGSDNNLDFTYWKDSEATVPLNNPESISKAGTFYISAKNVNNCTVTKPVKVIFVDHPESGLYLPNAFTPNGDGKNDFFGINKWIATQNVLLRVYDRWGRMIFGTSDPNQSWDGTFKGEPLKPDIYTYQLTVKSACGDFYRKGTVMLIR